MELAKYGEFDQIYIGIYSPRPGTIAYKKYEDNIPKETKKQRWALLNDLQIQNSITNNLKEHGKEREIIINKITDTEI
jgi:tRNA-2-methylthio-N6-dimethylallyladenosine synthase